MRAGSGPTRLAGALIVFAAAAFPPRAGAQAFTPPQGVGAVTLGWQYIDNTGHRFTDGYFLARGQSASQSLALDVEYAFTDRLTASVGIPYVFAKYTGALPPNSGLPVDSCQCWHSGFADFSAAARYRFGGETWAITPVARFGQPSHAYPYQGEAVLGNGLTELQIGAVAGLRLVEWLPRAVVQTGYTYALVERAIDDISVNRSDVFVDLGYAANRRVYVRAAWLWRNTHGGLNAGSTTGDPFFLPGELNTPERRAEGNRLLQVKYMQLVGGLAVNLGPVDVFTSFTKYVWGRDAHNGYAVNLGMSWYFGLPQ
jgi:hypothetical protein